MVGAVAASARKQPRAADAILVAATLNGRIDETAGLAALGRPERAVFDELVRLDAGLHAVSDDEADDESVHPAAEAGRRVLPRGGPPGANGS